LRRSTGSEEALNEELIGTGSRRAGSQSDFGADGDRGFAVASFRMNRRFRLENGLKQRRGSLVYFKHSRRL
jgi:hypothetical protein